MMKSCPELSLLLSHFYQKGEQKRLKSKSAITPSNTVHERKLNKKVNLGSNKVHKGCEVIYIVGYEEEIKKGY